jgi:hypothetical protein
MLSGNHIRVPLPTGQYWLVHVVSASVLDPYVTANQQMQGTIEHVVTALSTVHHNGSCVVPTTVDIYGRSITPSQIGIVRA